MPTQEDEFINIISLDLFAKERKERKKEKKKL